MDLKAEAQNLVQNLDQRMGPSAYDIAWMARLRNGSNPGPRWPELAEWLLENQHPDGSFGGAVPYYHDRVLCTTVGAIALWENVDTDGCMEASARAARYLWHNLHLLRRDPFELVGFELILPTLLSEANILGLDVPGHTCGYGEIQTQKLSMIPLEMLYSPKISTVYSLEFLGQAGDHERLEMAISENGSLGNSPAATAYYLNLLNREGNDDGRAQAYLENVRRHMDHVITVYPFSTFELAWVLNNFIYAGLPIRDMIDAERWAQLKADVEPRGAGFDRTFPVPDGDTTSVACRTLLHAGYEVSSEVLQSFEDRKYHIFRTYNYERNASVGTNIHALEAMRMMPDYPEAQQVKEHVVLMLLNQRKFNMYWVDKWHASPYYATSHTLIALMQEGDYLSHACRDTLEWLLHTQRADGSWGFFERGTAEETAYALIALLHYYHHVPLDEEILHRGAAFLLKTYEQKDHPELWIAKCLYTPVDIVRSAILAALILYQEAFGVSL